MGELDREWHQLLGLVDSEAEHQTLIAGAELTVHPGGDVGALDLNPVLDDEVGGGEPGIETVVSDAMDGVADDALDVRLGPIRDLPAD